MRLLNVDTLEFRDFPSDNIPPYLVTSHRWSTNEATYKDVLKRRNQESSGFKKIANFCAFAQQYSDIKWIWIDTCCINQNSSMEVSESINSMWEWYKKASHCVAYLRDVRPLSAGWDAVIYDFRRSEWFERGWTLQELLAPSCVVFLTQEWEVIGRRSPGCHDCPEDVRVLDTFITEVTGIPQHVLCGFESRRDNITTETKMAWAANRRTTKVEDVAYCLLGIFDVHMSMLYGEGERNARKRLEQEIVKGEREPEELQDGFAYQRSAQETHTEYQRYLANAQGHMDDVVMQGGDAPTPQTGDNAVPAEYLCPICDLLLYEPVTTTCGHTVCEPCIVTDEKVNIVIVPLDSEGRAGGESAMRNFEALQRCPVCDNLGWPGSLLALPDAPLAQTLRMGYTHLYTQRAAQVEESNEDTQTLTIHIGNWHELIKTHHHSWTFFVKPSRTDIIQEVHMQLHETFRNPHVVRTRPPYTLHGKGWGYFTIDVRVVLQTGFAWVVSDDDVEDGPDGATRAALKMEWTLDFASFGGRGAMGRCRVRVCKKRSRAHGDLRQQHLAHHGQTFSFPSISYNPAAANPLLPS